MNARLSLVFGARDEAPSLDDERGDVSVAFRATSGSTEV